MTWEIFQLETDSHIKGHGGGDYYLMKAFVEAISCNDQSKILSGAGATLESHRMVFSAKEARLHKSVISLDLEFRVGHLVRI